MWRCGPLVIDPTAGAATFCTSRARQKAGISCADSG